MAILLRTPAEAWAMYEVELKVRADHDRVRPALEDLGAREVGTVEQVDTYYDAPHRDLAETDEALRVRRETDAAGDGDEVARVTYKGPLVEAASKTREEFETGIDDADALDDILGGLGFSPAATVEKRRERYRHEGYTVTLDRVAGLGEFVEVERAAPEDEIEAVREGAVALLASLGLDPDEQIRTSYLELVLDDGG